MGKNSIVEENTYSSRFQCDIVADPLESIVSSLDTMP